MRMCCRCIRRESIRRLIGGECTSAKRRRGTREQDEETDMIPRVGCDPFTIFFIASIEKDVDIPFVT